MNTRPIIIKQLIIFVIIAFLFFVFGFITSNYQLKTIKNEFFQSGWKAAMERLKEGGIFPANIISGEGIETTVLAGTVKEIKNNNLILKVRRIDPFFPELDERMVEITKETRIFKREQENNEQKEKMLKMEDLTSGQLIGVKSEENIGRKKQFQAKILIVFKEAENKSQ